MNSTPSRRHAAHGSALAALLCAIGIAAFPADADAGPFDGQPSTATRRSEAQSDRRFIGRGKTHFPSAIRNWRSNSKSNASADSRAADRSPSREPRDFKRFGFLSRGKRSDRRTSDDSKDSKVRLTFLNATWETVLKKIADATDSELVMNRIPPGRFSRYDRRKYSRKEAVRVLNQELEPKGFRLVEKGKYLDVLHLRTARAEYRRPALPAHRASRTAPPDVRPRRDRFRKYERRVTPIATRPQRRNRDGRAVRPAAHTTLSRLNVSAGQQEKAVIRVVGTRHYKAADLARAIYRPLIHRCKLVDAGPHGLPAFDVMMPAIQRDRFARRSGDAGKVLFTIGIDAERNELVVQAPPQQNREVIRLIHHLDCVELARGDVLKVVPTRSHPTPIAKTLQPQLILLAQNAQSKTQPAGKQPAGKVPPGAVNVIRGRVTIRDVPGVGLVVTGNKEDVEAVLRIIKELDEQGLLTTPNVEVLPLRHVNSMALAELLTAVYLQLNTIRTGQTQQVGSVAFIPVVRPNALMIISSKIALPAVEKLIQQLDRPVDPQKEYQVFHLKTAVASQIVANLDALFQQAAAATGQQANAAANLRGLATRVRAIADVRANAVIVEAAPNDMKIVANLIYRLDQEQIKSVSRVRVFRLKNAVASELAELINTSIQSVINPPTLTGGQVGGVGAGGTSSQALRDAKSSILEFMTADAGDRKRLVRSGILTDIRVTADPRINALVVTAPELSLKLMEALISELDQPSALVAEIKVFTLANGDATAMLNLLQALFPSQTAGQAQQGQLGFQTAGADDASSGLIPLRFSVDPRTNSIIAVGGAGALRVVEAVIFRLDESDIRRRQTTVIKLKNSPVTEVSTAINSFLQSQRDLFQIDPNIVTNMELLEREIIVVPETVSNSLLISATPRYFEEIQRIVENLDRAPAQVVIQALIVEVELNNTDEFGVELGFQDPLLFQRGLLSNLETLETTATSPNGVQTTTQDVVAQTRTPGFNFVGSPLGTNTAAHPSSVGTQGFNNLSLGRVNGELGFGGLVLSAQSSSISVLLRALAAKRTVHVLSRPQVTALDNQLAQINVGQIVPRVTGVTTTATGSANPILNDENVGIILTVTPRVR
ncbi:MAG: secretin N-terminal domain-containing protein, partial [Planctomycetaceae bacterium]